MTCIIYYGQIKCQNNLFKSYHFPSQKRHLYRGIKNFDTNELEVNKEYYWPAFSSASLDRNVAIKFSEEDSKSD